MWVLVLVLLLVLMLLLLLLTLIFGGGRKLTQGSRKKRFLIR
jgi:hypothetical protein